jgi:class 3 adenylate cyclase
VKLTPIVGLAMTLAVAGVDLAGGFTSWERSSIDLRFSAAPRPFRPMTGQIAHVDVDDGAIDRVGRWPWDRTTLADLIDEIRLAGARTIAIDMLLTEEQSPEQDAALAEALGRCVCVLPVVIQERELWDAAWLSLEGQRDRQRILKVLSGNIWLDPAQVLEAAEVTDPNRAGRYRLRPLEFKRAAAWDALHRDAREATTFAELESRVAPQKGEFVGSYAERATLAAVWRQHQAWRALRPLLLPGDSQGGTFLDGAPLPALAAQADLVGFVNADRQRHADGTLREIDTRLPARGGFVPPFGLAAAAAHLGLGPEAISASDDVVLVGERRLPLRRGRLWINWPRSDTDPRWLGLLRQSPEDEIDAGHVSARALVEMAGARRDHDRNQSRLAETTNLVLDERDRRAARAALGDPLSEEHRREARDEATFLLGVDEGAPVPAARLSALREQVNRDGSLTEAQRQAQLDHLERCARWLEIDVAPAEDQAAARAEWSELTVNVLLAARPLPPRPARPGPEQQDAARREVTQVLAEPRAADPHADLCRLWLELEDAVRDGAERIPAEESRLRERLEDRLIFLGYTASGAVVDVVRTPIDASTPGVVTHAVIADMILGQRPVRFMSGGLAPLLALALGVLCVFAAVGLPPLVSAGAVLGGLALYAAGAGWAFAQATFVLPLVAPLAAGAASWTVCTTMQAALSRRERQRITRQFKARVSGQLVEHLVSHPDELSVSGAEREVSVLFADLANFTSISEALGGPLSVATLNRCLRELVKVLVAEGAYVNKFLGDGLMAFWSAFAVDPQQATRACDAALRCQAAMARLNQEAQGQGMPAIGLRIGIATGRAVVGDCGAPPAINDYTVIGDTVNLAARLESANKQFGTGVLINGRTRELIEGSPHRVRLLGRMVVAGQSTPVKVFELLPEGAAAALIEVTERAVAAFAAGRFEEARGDLEDLERRFGQEKLAGVYREAIADVGEVFDGVLHLHLK